MKQFILTAFILNCCLPLFAQQNNRGKAMGKDAVPLTQSPEFETILLRESEQTHQVGLLISIPYSQLDFQWSTDRDLYIADAEIVFALVNAKDGWSTKTSTDDKPRRWGNDKQDSGLDAINNAEIDTTITFTLSTSTLGTIQDSVHTQGFTWTIGSSLYDAQSVAGALFTGDKQLLMRTTPKPIALRRSVLYPVVERGDSFCAQSIRPSLVYNTNARILWLTTETEYLSAQNRIQQVQFFNGSNGSKADQSSDGAILPAMDIVAHSPSILDESSFLQGRICVSKQSEFESDVIDGKKLPNEPISLVVGQERFVWQSIWQDMPRSLRNLEIAIQAIEFIEEERVVDQMMKGSNLEKKESFFDFWSPMDPTPETHFNELMVEFYRRVDQAAAEFSSPSLSLLESDQAKVFIRYGEPDSKSREFPPGGKTQEVWRYGQTEFLFEASSGFGDFVLISPASL